MKKSRWGNLALKLFIFGHQLSDVNGLTENFHVELTLILSDLLETPKPSQGAAQALCNFVMLASCELVEGVAWQAFEQLWVRVHHPWILTYVEYLPKPLNFTTHE